MATQWTGAGDGVSWEDASNWDNGAPGSAFNDSVITFGSVVCVSSNPGTCGIVGGTLTFASGATNASGSTVSGSATFIDSSYNAGTITGDATFGGSAYNDGAIYGNANFAGTAYNGTAGTISGNAIFSDNSANYGTISGNVTFNGYSGLVNPGYVLGNATFNDSSSIVGGLSLVQSTIFLPGVRVGENIESANTSFRIHLTGVPEGGGGSVSINNSRFK
jgi:hypothetical protein